MLFRKVVLHAFMASVLSLAFLASCSEPPAADNSQETQDVIFGRFAIECPSAWLESEYADDAAELFGVPYQNVHVVDSCSHYHDLTEGVAGDADVKPVCTVSVAVQPSIAMQWDQVVASYMADVRKTGAHAEIVDMDGVQAIEITQEQELEKDVKLMHRGYLFEINGYLGECVSITWMDGIAEYRERHVDQFDGVLDMQQDEIGMDEECFERIASSVHIADAL